MKSVAEALDAVLAGLSPLSPERVALDSALDRVLARDVHARTDSPAFDNSAMDGYAVVGADVARAGARLPVVGESRAGGPLPPQLSPGSAVRIYTGAAMPEGADTVVIQEDTRRAGGDVEIRIASAPHRHVRTRGSDLQAGQMAVKAGRRIGPGEIALLSSQDFASVDVTRQPRVAILCTGDELRDIGAPRRPGSIVNSNAHALAAQVRRAGGQPWVLPPAPDELNGVRERIEQGLTADLLLCSGGVSVGDYDIVRDAFEQAGVRQDFWKVAMKPGKPVSVGRHGETLVIGLPGNPVSAFVTFELFVRPALRKMSGDARPHLSHISVQLAHAHRHHEGRLELARARLQPATHAWQAELTGRQGSGALPALVDVDALVLLPADQGEFAEGETLQALLLQGPGAAQSPFDWPQVRGAVTSSS